MYMKYPQRSERDAAFLKTNIYFNILKLNKTSATIDFFKMDVHSFKRQIVQASVYALVQLHKTYQLHMLRSLICEFL